MKRLTTKINFSVLVHNYIDEHPKIIEIINEKNLDWRNKSPEYNNFVNAQVEEIMAENGLSPLEKDRISAIFKAGIVCRM